MVSAEVDLEIRPKTMMWQYRDAVDLYNIDDIDASDDSELQEETEVAEPSDAKPEKQEVEWVPLLEWTYVQQKVPWTIIFLFSGGFVLNQGFKDSGMDMWMGESMKSMTNLPFVGLLFIIMILTAIISTVASNTACANILIPIMAVLAQNSRTIHPYRLMFPICFMTSCCFLLPVSTPPNLIAYGYGRLTMKDFLLHGSVFTIVSILIIVGMCEALLGPVFSANTFPDWALPDTNSTALMI